MRGSVKGTVFSFMLACVLVLGVFFLGACSGADPVSPPSVGPPPVAVPSLAVSPPGDGPGDSLSYTVVWGRSADALGAAESYSLSVADSTTGAVLQTVTTSDTSAVVNLPIPPATDLAHHFLISVTATRRGLTSAPVSGYVTVARLDFVPATPSLHIDTLPLVLIGTAQSCERSLPTGPLLDVRGDTLFFISPYLTGFPTWRSCLPQQVLAVTEGATQGDSLLPALIYQPGSTTGVPLVRLANSGRGLPLLRLAR